MKTSRLIRRALKYIGVVEGNDPVPAEDFTDALDELNLMCGEIADTAGLTLDFDLVDLTGTEDFPFPRGVQGGLAAMLAVRLSPEYGEAINPMITQQSIEGWSALVGLYHDVPNSSPNYTLTRDPYTYFHDA